MHHFDYRDGVLNAEAVSLDTLAAEVGTPFYCYSTATLERHYQVFADAFADVTALVCYAMKANSNQAVIRTLGRLGAGVDVVSERRAQAARVAAGIAADKIMFSGVGKTARGDGPRARRGHPLLQRRIGAGARAAVDDRRRRRAATAPHLACASIPTSTPRPTHKISTGKAENKFGIPISRARDGLCAGRASCPASRSPASTCISAARSPTSIRSATPSRCSPNSCARCAPTATRIEHIDLGGGLGIPYRDDNDAAAASGRLCRGRQARNARSRLQADLRARPADRRQCRHPGHARALREARRGEDLRHRRRRHERPDPPDAL